MNIPVIRVMQIIVLSDENSKKELLSNQAPDLEIIWARDVEAFLDYPEADAFIDLQFEKEEKRIQLLASLLPALVVINSVEHTLKETDASFVRINGWSGFLNSLLIEASGKDQIKQRAEQLFSCLGKKLEWQKDEPGFISARVVCMIINEAFLALDEKISTKEEIDTAMKLGTNYPYGPFEWSEKIGVKNIYSLLKKLSRDQFRYQPSPLLSES